MICFCGEDGMKRLSPLNLLLLAQFLSAFVDNMILFSVRAILITQGYEDYYLSFVQGVFLFAYVILAPLVGAFADRNPKSTVLLIGNGVKTVGVLAMMVGMNPALAYGIVGIGAVIYSPAKYGILPWLTSNENQLLKANAHLEGTTILAILTGAIAGGYLADVSPLLSLVIPGVLYGLSIGIAWFIPKNPGDEAIRYGRSARDFFKDTAFLFRDPVARYSLVGTGAFWMATSVLRMILFAWVPLMLGINDGASIAKVIGITGVGICVGSVLTPYLISLEKYQRTLFYGFGMGACILAMLVVSSLWQTVALLLLVGFLGGVYIVPMNACLQKIGGATIGSGKTIAIQNLVENSFMFLGIIGYMEASRLGVSVHRSIQGVGILFLGILFLMLATIISRKIVKSKS